MGRSEAPCVPAGCLSLPSLLAAWSGDERPDRPGNPPVRGCTRSPQPVREELSKRLPSSDLGNVLQYDGTQLFSIISGAMVL